MLNETLFEDILPTVRTFRRRFQNVIRQARNWAGNAIEDIIERNLCVFRVAAFAGFN